MSALSRTFGILTLASTLWFAGEVSGQTPPPTLDQIRLSKTLRIGYDTDAPPFSYIPPGSPASAAPQGYSVDLCRAVADQFKEQLKVPDLKVAYVAVNSVTRFDTIVDNKADLLCESSTATLSRRTKVDLTTEQELRRALTGTRIDAEIVLAKTNQEGLDLLGKGQVAAYFADRATLTFLLRKEKQFANLLMADTYLSIEPIALALRRGDNDFRLAVDTALSHIYRQGKIVQVFKGAFGPLNTPSQLLAALYQISGLPD